jgi:DNA (cytosine-5)-methyltransferase 1
VKVRQKFFWFNDAHDHPLPTRPIVVDGFAGGGGASVGLARALGRDVDVAINHDREAIAMHMANHPRTKHYCENIWTVDPLDATEGREVLAAWFSPDCTHHSKARGAKPVKKNIRALAWIAVKWAEAVKPKIIFVENVEEFRQWGPVDKVTKRPIESKKGVTFDLWVWKLRELGYTVEWREMVASDFGAPTTRKRLFIIARCDGKPIVWPEPSHGGPAQIAKEVKQRGSSSRQPWRTAAEIIDWNLPCPSIFLSRAEGKAAGCNRPLADKTMKRIAEGIRRYVIENPNPFIVRVDHGGDHFRGQPLDRPLSTVTQSHGYAAVDAALAPFQYSQQQGGKTRPIDEPHRTITASDGDCNVVVTPFISRQFGQGVGQPADNPAATIVGMNKSALVAPQLMSYYGERKGQTDRGRLIESPVPTVTTENRFALVSAFIAKHFGGMVGTSAERPFPTITTVGTQNNLVAATLIKNNHGDKQAFDVEEPLRTVVAGGQHHALIESRLEHVRAFLFKYFGSGTNVTPCDKPTPTITTRDRLALGLVYVAGEPYQIVDIGMRMLTPRELFRAQGFPSDYAIDVSYDGRPVSKSAQVARCGNSVCPDVVEALVRANIGEAA